MNETAVTTAVFYFYESHFLRRDNETYKKNSNVKT